MIRNFRSLVIWFLALWRDLNLKQIGARIRVDPKQVSKILKRREIADEDYAPLLAVVSHRPAEAQVVTGCLEDLEDLENAADLSDEELLGGNLPPARCGTAWHWPNRSWPSCCCRMAG